MSQKEKLTITKLFTDASKQLIADFEFARKTNPHSATKGEEVENILKDFLNSHLPKRYDCCSGIIIDNTSNMSKQMDVIIYDSLASPVYRCASTTQILPIDTVASVIEVKSSLTRSELEDAYRKIYSVKNLQKTAFSEEIDKAPTGSQLCSTNTLGIIFAFDSAITMDKIAEHVKKLNEEYDSYYWPDLIVILGKGIIDYGIAFPGEEDCPGSLALHSSKGLPPPPFFIHIIKREDKDLALNRFFIALLSQLTLFPHRPSVPPFSSLLEGGNTEAMVFYSYQYNTDSLLNLAPDELTKGIQARIEGVKNLTIQSNTGEFLSRIEFIPWQDGAIIRSLGVFPLAKVLSLVGASGDSLVLVDKTGRELSTVMKINTKDFEEWKKIIEANPNLKCQ